jgi:hypothetical protein
MLYASMYILCIVMVPVHVQSVTELRECMTVHGTQCTLNRFCSFLGIFPLALLHSWLVCSTCTINVKWYCNPQRQNIPHWQGEIHAYMGRVLQEFKDVNSK